MLSATIGWQPDWVDVLQAQFMRNAFLAGTILCIAAGAVGFFVIVRRQAFAAHALAHIGFPGATAAVVAGVSVTLGLTVFCVLGSLAIGFLGRKAEERDVATGTVLAFATGLGVLFASIASGGAGTVTNVLFGNLLAVSTTQVVTFACFSAILLGVIAWVARPLAFASLQPEVAQARGVPVRTLSILFLVLLALVVVMAVEVVGTLLLFALVVTPAATALSLTARPALIFAASVAFGLLSVWSGLVLSAMFNLPPSFAIVTVATILWLASVVRAWSSDRGAAQAAAGARPAIR